MRVRDYIIYNKEENNKIYSEGVQSSETGMNAWYSFINQEVNNLEQYYGLTLHWGFVSDWREE